MQLRKHIYFVSEQDNLECNRTLRDSSEGSDCLYDQLCNVRIRISNEDKSIIPCQGHSIVQAPQLAADHPGCWRTTQ